jgi:hypothetical protein
MTPEQEARAEIDCLLTAAGWRLRSDSSEAAGGSHNADVPC